MERCSHCGNLYDKTFKVIIAEDTYIFDSLECAIHLLAPRCHHCGVSIIGHGLEKNNQIFCCNHCAKSEGVTELRDRAGS